jgi:hypothetical protein
VIERGEVIRVLAGPRADRLCGCKIGPTCEHC